MNDPYRLKEVRRYCELSVGFIDGRAMKHFWLLGDRAAASFIMVLGTLVPKDTVMCSRVCDGLQLAFGQLERITCAGDRIPTMSLFLLETILASSTDPSLRARLGSAIVWLRDIVTREGETTK
jgi:hypothetical protein